MSGSRSPNQPSIVDVVRLLTATRRRRVLAGVCSLLITIVALPVVQGVVYGILVGSPGVLQWTVLGGLSTAVAVRRADTNPQAVLLVGVGLTLVFALIVGPWVGSIYTREHLADEMATQAIERETLPNTSTERARVLPREVADQYADSSVQFPQYRTSTSDIAYRNGSYVWSYALVPDNLFVRLFGAQRGAVYVDMERSDKRVAVRETQFQNGRGQLVTDSFAYRTTLHRPTVRHRPDTAFVFEHEGQAYLAQSFVRHEWHVRLTPLPQVYAVPRFGGVELMDQDGDIQTIPAADVEESDRLVGQNVYPYHLVRLRVLATNLDQGYLNTITAKEGVLRLARLPSEDNNWPVTVPTGTADHPELTYFVATEPTGGGSGVFRVYTFDAQTGTPTVTRFGDAQTGPRRAVEFTRQNEDVARLNNIRVVEPVPVVREGTLYWQVKVIPASANGITFTGFVNSNTGETQLFSRTDRITTFATDGRVIADRDDGMTTESSGTVVEVTVVNENGTVVTQTNVTVPENGRVGVTVNRTGNESTGTS